VDEFHTVTGTSQAAETLTDLRAAGLPITTVWVPFRMASHWRAITVPADWRDALPGLDTAAFTHRIAPRSSTPPDPAVWRPRPFVLDDDIDPSDDDLL
jgi:hypothetical protein